MGIQNIPIPGYLEPPPQDEALADARAAAAQKQGATIAKAIAAKVAMEKLIGDTRVAQAGGMDPQEAQQAALYSNAPSLFPNDPEKVTQLQTAILQKQKFQQAKKDYQSAFDADVKGGMAPDAAFIKNWSHYAPDLVPGSSLGPTLSRNYATEEHARTAEMKTGVDLQKFTQSQELRKTIADAGLIQKEQQFLSKEDRLSKEADRKAGIGVDAPKPVITTTNGVTVAYMPGSKALHMVNPGKAETLKSFITKNAPALIKSGLTQKQATDQLETIWNEANKAGAADEAARNPQPGADQVDPNNPLSLKRKQ